MKDLVRVETPSGVKHLTRDQADALKPGGSDNNTPEPAENRRPVKTKDKE